MTIKSTLAILTLAAIGLLAVESQAHADMETCSFAGHGSNGLPTYEVQKVEYFHAPSNFNFNAFRCDWNTGRCSLSGWMISKRVLPTTGKQPAVIFLHGSEGGIDNFIPIEDDQSLTSYSCPIKKFVDAGYVVFMPYRRGVFDQTSASTLPVAARGLEGWSSSGWAANEWAVNSVNNQGATMNHDNYTGQYIDYLLREIDDLVFAMNTLDNFTRPDMTSKLVDAARVAVVGHSFGGVMSTLAAADDDLFDLSLVQHGPRAFVSLSGAAMSYHTSHWFPEVLTDAASHNNAPLMFTRAIDEDARSPNDFASAREPFNALGHFPAKSGMALFSNVNATCTTGVSPWQCQHTAFVTNAAQIARWFPTVNGMLLGAGM